MPLSATFRATSRITVCMCKILEELKLAKLVNRSHASCAARRTQHCLLYDIVFTVHHDKLCNRTNEMHFFSFLFDNNLYMFRIGKLFRLAAISQSIWTQDTYQTLHIRSPPDDEKLAYSKHVGVIVKNKTQKVHLSWFYYLNYYHGRLNSGHGLTQYLFVSNLIYIYV